MNKDKLKFISNKEKDWKKKDCLNSKNRLLATLKIAQNVTDDDRKTLRYIIKQNIKFSEKLETTPSYYRLPLVCLFKIMKVEDTILFCEAKFDVDFDTGFYACPEMIVGRNKKETIKYLKSKGEKDIIRYLKTLDYSVLSTYEDYCKKADKYIAYVLKEEKETIKTSFSNGKWPVKKE